METAEVVQKMACVFRVGARCMVGINVGGGISIDLGVAQSW